MIQLACGEEPAILAANRVAWGQEYAAAVAAGGDLPQRYRREEVKDALRAETYGKCAYCESRIEHISFSHIEHILPKAVRPDLVCAWENLTLACEKCNIYKGDYCSVLAPLLNPYTDDVTEAITFYGPMAIDRTDSAKLTISRMRLNRADLLFKRSEALREILHILDLLIRTIQNEALQNALVEDLKVRLASDAEYSSCARCFERDEAPRRALNPPVSAGGAQAVPAEQA